jgi:putative ABC transport system permease protein
VSAARRWLWRLWGTLHSGARERDLDEELRSHLELDIEARMRAGADADEARRAALLQLGGLLATKERVRDQERVRWLHDAALDVRFALRTFTRERTFFVVVVLSFALGVGANTAIFGAVNAVLLRPLPYPDDTRLVALATTDRREGSVMIPTTPADFADWQAAARSFSAMAPSSDAIFTLTGAGDPESLIGYKLAPEMFAVLGVRPALGRVFDASDGSDVVVLGDRLWRRRFHADPAIVGHSIRLDQRSYTVVGVMAPEFRHPAQSELWTPLVLGADARNDRQSATLRIVARLRPGVSEAAARGELRAIAATLATAHPDSNRFRGAAVTSLRTVYSGDARPVLLVLLGAVALVLLLTSSNIAVLSLARAARRGREMAVRTALGAGRGRLLRQLLTESLLLAGVGGGLGLLLALWGCDLLVQLFPKNVSNLSMPLVEHIPLDGAVVLFSFVATVVAGVAAGLVPAIRGSRANLGQALKEGGRGAAPSSRLQPWLVVAQIALALTFSTAAGLTIGAAQARQRALGFDAESIFTARVLLDRTRHPDAARRRLFVDQLISRLRGAPGVRSVGVTQFLPLCGWYNDATFRTSDRPEEEREAGLNIADAGYFTTLHIPIVRGRNFGDGDRAAAPGVALVDERFARRFFGRRDVVGKRLDLGSAGKPEWYEIIGVVGDVENDPPPSHERPMIYLSPAQADVPFFGLVLRSDGDPTVLASLVRDALAGIDRDQPLSYVMTMKTLVGDALAVERTSMLILSFFAAVALLLAAMGIYGVLASCVSERYHEIAIRLALGAQPRQVIGFMLRRLTSMVAAGLGLGVAGALAGGRLLGALVNDVPASSPGLLVVAVALLTLVAMLAAWSPLRRALAIDPMLALREQ